MPNIIVEGIDGTGKSYLVKILSELLQMEAHWPGGPPSDDIDMVNRLNWQLNQDNTIFDRLTCISEACYRKNLSFEHNILLKIYRDLHLSLGDIVIFCSNIIGEDESGYQDEGHQKDVQDRLMNIEKNYCDIMCNIKYISYRAKIDDVHELVEILKDMR